MTSTRACEDDTPGAVELVFPPARFDVPVTVTTAEARAVPSSAVTTAVPGPTPKTAPSVSTTATAGLLVDHAAPASRERGAAWPSLSRPFRVSGLLAPWPSRSVAGLMLSERTPMVTGLGRFRLTWRASNSFAHCARRACVAPAEPTVA